MTQVLAASLTIRLLKSEDGSLEQKAELRHILRALMGLEEELS